MSALAHGTAGAYSWRKCRCEDCTQAASEARQQFRHAAGVVPLETQRARRLWDATEKFEGAERGACRGVDVDLFFQSETRTDKHGTTDFSQARAICAQCPVMIECRTYAVECREPEGSIWGGMSYRERRAWARERGM